MAPPTGRYLAPTYTHRPLPTHIGPTYTHRPYLHAEAPTYTNRPLPTQIGACNSNTKQRSQIDRANLLCAFWYGLRAVGEHCSLVLRAVLWVSTALWYHRGAMGEHWDSVLRGAMGEHWGLVLSAMGEHTGKQRGDELRRRDHPDPPAYQTHSLGPQRQQQALALSHDHA
eukprot:346870-Rhodomonas_salina.1